MATIQDKVNSIAEMFPKHRRDTIEGILMEMNGDEENTISILLDTPENAPPPPKSKSSQPSYPGAGAPSAAPGGYPGAYAAPPPGPGGYPGAYASPMGYPPAGAPAPGGYPGAYAAYSAPPPGPGGYPGAYAAPAAYPSQSNAPKPAPKPKPKPAQLPKFDHIFADDFLRWPDNAEVVRVSRDGTVMPMGPQGVPNQATAPSYPGANPTYPGQPPSYPGAAPSYPGAAPSYPGAAPSYPGAAPSYQPTYNAYGNPTYPGSNQSYPACNPMDDQAPMPTIGVDSNLIPGVDADSNKTAGWWSNFKARFSKKQNSNQYQNLS